MITSARVKNPMVIDDWNGWVWTCYNCDHVDREATSEELKDRHDQVNAWIKEHRP